MNLRHGASPVRIAAVSGAAVALLAGAGACSSSSSSGAKPPASSSATSSSTSAPTAAAATITITNFTFTGPTSVPAGATVAVTNSDSVDHTVTSDGLSQFDVRAPAGQTVTFKAPGTAGTYPYHCSIHPQMHGSLVVK